ncbi:TPA: restriction endonuclease subunit S [Citrobacter freundii]
MSSNLTSTYSLGDVADVYDGPHATPKKLEQGDAIFLSISSLEQGRLNLEQSSYISEDDYIKWTRRVTPQPGDVVFSYETKIGEASIIPEGLRCCLGRRMGLLRAKRNKVIPDFLLYAYLSPAFQEVIREKTIHGSTTDRLSIKEMPSFKIQIPDVRKQNEIIKILKPIDVKLEFNQQVNKTLEQMAQALFKSWFVDFEPVKAKMAVLATGGSQADATRAAMTAISGKDADALAVFERKHPEQYAELKATAELFPSAMQDSELGEIPVGWRTAIVESVINRLKVKNTFPADCIKLFGQHPVLEQGARIYQGYHDEEPSFNASLQSPMFIFGDHTCVMHLSTVPFDISKNTLVLKGKIFNTYWTFFALKGKQKFQEYKRHWSDLKVKQVVIPDENNGLLLTNYFASKCENLFGLLEQNRKQNLILQNTRDTLLPKLLSGEITLPEAEQIISEEA